MTRIPSASRHLMTAMFLLCGSAVSAQADGSDEHYSMSALKAEATDVGEKMACYLKIYASAKDRVFEQEFGKAYEMDMARFSNRVEAHVTRFAPRRDRFSTPVFRFNTWHNLSFFIDKKESEIRRAPDATVIGRCNTVAASAIQQLRAAGVERTPSPRRR